MGSFIINCALLLSTFSLCFQCSYGSHFVLDNLPELDRNFSSDSLYIPDEIDEIISDHAGQASASGTVAPAEPPFWFFGNFYADPYFGSSSASRSALQMPESSKSSGVAASISGEPPESFKYTEYSVPTARGNVHSDPYFGLSSASRSALQMPESSKSIGVSASISGEPPESSKSTESSVPSESHKKRKREPIYSLSELNEFSGCDLLKYYDSIDNRHDRRQFIQDLLLSRYNEDISPPCGHHSSISWSKVNVLGWPEEVKSYSIYGLTLTDCRILIPKIRNIHFERKPEHHSTNSPLKCTKEINTAIYEELKNISGVGPKGFVQWEKLHARFPELVLKTHDYRVWSEQDRQLITNLVFPELKKDRVQFHNF
jgi:hypothetical protein